MFVRQCCDLSALEFIFPRSRFGVETWAQRSRSRSRNSWSWPRDLSVIFSHQQNNEYWNKYKYTNPFPWNLRSKSPIPYRTPRFRPTSAHSASTVRASEKCSTSSSLIASRPRAFQQAIDEPLRYPSYIPKGWHKTKFCCFVSKIQLLSKEVGYKVWLCENLKRQGCSYIIPL